ncbi:ceramide synthase LOH2 [Argentina anserina]|uniref:ceramide synthase LOH2 n=1 Tax=Argentina anserina TaxID=57926 RepID=UPI0021766F32|nr:ceramide synthase LOH2 [Potentilla anserina]
MDSFWSHSAAPDSLHFLVAISFAVGFFFARLFLDRLVFTRLAIWLSTKGSAPLKIDMVQRAKLVKCSESMWKLTYYATVEACILSISYQEPWFTDTSEFFKGWPNQELGLPLKLVYMCQCGFYTYSIVALLTWETRRKDFSVMMSHHVITVFLIGMSYITSFFRIGSIILALHDGSDVFMEAAKVFKYSGKELAASVLFGCFAVSWLVLRLIYFPFWVISSSSYDLVKHLDLSKSSHTTLYYLFNTMLMTLLVFHIYWWVMIFSMIRRQLNNSGKVGEDIRSDSDDDD